VGATQDLGIGLDSRLPGPRGATGVAAAVMHGGGY